MQKLFVGNGFVRIDNTNVFAKTFYYSINRNRARKVFAGVL